MSGYGESRTFETHPGAGGVESEALGLPFKSTPCEDWYGFGDTRCPNRYEETGDLETDIKSLIVWIGRYSGHGRTGWMVWATNELYRKQAEVAEMQRERASLQLTEEQRQRQQKLLQLNEEIVTLEQKLISEQKLQAGYGAGHWILRSNRFDTIPILKAKIEQKKTRN
tara:strand:+ start:55 stop:558 length:504 start_codon:yes stop_codon:yes gene_type:complete